MRVLDLFSGIGAFSVGLERAGFQTVAFCEANPFARRVLAKHWPDVPCYDDVRTLTAERLRADGVDANVICGGWPCQDLSIAGNGAGLAGERSGLWSEIARLVGELRPRYVILENVAVLTSRGLGDVLGDLAAVGYDAEWHCIPAAAVGAPHRRDRIWIVAYADSGRRGRLGLVQHCEEQGAPGDQPDRLCEAGRRAGEGMGVAGSARLPIGPRTLAERARAATTGAGWWATEPDVGRVAHGPAARLDRRERITALGGSLVPAIPEIIGQAIIKFDNQGEGES